MKQKRQKPNIFKFEQTYYSGTFETSKASIVLCYGVRDNIKAPYTLYSQNGMKATRSAFMGGSK